MDSKSLVTDLHELQVLAKQHHDDFEVLGYMLELHEELTDQQIDNWVKNIAQPIINAIDCKACANCCRSLDVYLTEEDAKRLTNHIDIPLDSILDHPSAQKVGEWAKFKERPCGFLDGNLCQIYPHRPETCRTYPALTPDFRWLIDDIIEGASGCPIIYNVLIALTDHIEDLYSL